MSLQRADLTLAAHQDHLELQNILVSGCTPEILVDLVLGIEFGYLIFKRTLGDFPVH